MKKFTFIFGLIIAFSIVVTGCSTKDKSKNKDVSVQSTTEISQIEDDSSANPDEEAESNLDEPANNNDENSHFDASVLEGEWELVSGETDGYEYSAEEAGYTTKLTIDAAGAHYSHTLYDETKSFDAELKYRNVPLYEGCGNDEWSVEFVMIESDFDAEEEYYATLTSDDTLLLQCFFPFDGTQGVSYETYKRK
ncbi:MAG: hypothetical protein IJB70_10400 [Clostridia bacterium]|nr:hypothetical protein [Clostridia bacterium]